MTEYYYVASLLPQLDIGHVPALSFADLKDILKINLNKEDYKLVQRFLRMIDLENLRSYWAGEPIDPRGNFNANEIEHALVDVRWPNGDEFPQYLLDYLDKYRTNDERLHNFSILMNDFLQDEIEKKDGFLQEYFEFQREWRLVMTGFRAKKLGRDVIKELQFEDVNDPIVAQIIAQKDAKVYEPPFEYKELKPIFEAYADSPLELHRALYEYQFNHIIEVWGGELFSMNRILSYMAQLLIVERWLELDVQQGINIVDEIEGKIQT